MTRILYEDLERICILERLYQKIFHSCHSLTVPARADVLSGTLYNKLIKGYIKRELSEQKNKKYIQFIRNSKPKSMLCK